ncbi:MAG: tetratricopeptide repeat protein, partial [Bryobacteraceae bacterium]
MAKVVEKNQGFFAAAESSPASNGVANRDASLRALAAAVSLHIKGKPEEALKELEGAEASADAADLAEIHAARGHIYSELGQFAPAAGSYSRLCELVPNNSEARYKLGLCLQNLGKYEMALASFQAAISLGDQELKTRLSVGGCLLHLNKGPEALVEF